MTQSYLLDTSVWINLTKHDKSTKLNFTKALDAGSALSYCGPVLMEMLAGAKHGEDFQLQARLDAFQQMPHDIYFVYRQAGLMYRELRRKGITIRSYNDCLIAVIAMSHENVTLIHDDQDFELIAEHYDLKQERWARAA